MKIDLWFEELWRSYSAIAPRVSQIRAILEARGEEVVNDHVAFRTLDIAPIDLEALGAVVEGLGYEPFDDYRFEEKKLNARSYSHPAGWPRVFLSELRVGELHDDHQQILRRLVDGIDLVIDPRTFVAGTPWAPVTYDEYLGLQKESEYAAWVAALGLRPNHFTVSVNELETFADQIPEDERDPTEALRELLRFVETSGYDLNEAGGRIKGSKGVKLEQGSTLADRLQVEFAGGVTHEIPTCYYEFALRHPNDDGTLYDGFVTQSADKIFESTHASRG